MTISAGTRLGPYEILSPIGAGGMGEVWRARDTRLERNVAIKVLPASVAHDAQLLLRFEREAKTISQLNHPFICRIYDVGESSGDRVAYLVMELLEGESLADRLARGALPIGDVLRYATQIGEALAAAHRAGIVHRDVKPGNIMLTKSGAKLLDFGLAKAGTPSAVISGTPFSETEHKPLTQEGTIIGTFRYMAPEQLEGQEADARTDIFAFGAVLYEMATGKRAFEGKNRTSLIAAIVDRDPPPISQFQPLTPPAFERLVKTCLEKDPENRWQTAHDLLLQLRWIAEAGSQAGVAAPVVVRRRTRERLAWMCAIALLLTTATFAFLWRRLAQQPLSRVELSVLPPDQGIFEFVGGGLALSPDGQKIVHVVTKDGTNQLWIRQLSAGTAQPLNGTENALYPFWSPDSRHVAFFSTGKLRRIAVSGGPPQALCDAPNGRGGSWNSEGVIVFAPSDRDPIHRVSASGGTPVAVTQLPQNEYSHRWPAFLPDGEHFLYLAQSANAAQVTGRIYAGSTASKERRDLATANSPSAATSSGHLLYMRDQTLLAQPFDAEDLKLTGDAFPVADQIRYNGSTGWGAFTVARNGTIAYQAAGARSSTQLAWYDRTGKALGVLSSAGGHFNPRLSWKGDRVAYELTTGDGATSDIWIHDVERDVPTRFTFQPVRESNPTWTRDDARIIYTAEEENRTSRNIVQKISTGAGNDETLLLGGAAALTTIDVSPDGRFLTFIRISPKTRTLQDLWLFSFADRKATPLLQSRFQDQAGFFSPDGRWLAYVSDESGRREIYVQPFPPTGAKWQISSSGGRAPRWSRDGRELFFFSPDDKLMSAEVPAASGTFSAGVPKALFTTRMTNGFDVAADGQRFLVNQPVRDEVQSPITVVLNWAAGLNQ